MRSGEPDDDATILRLLRSGQAADRERAIGILQKKYGEKISSLVKRKAANGIDPAHVLHDALLDFEKIVISGEFQEDRYGIWPLLHRIAERKAIDAFRREGSRKRHFKDLAGESDGIGPAGDKPDEQLHAKEQRERMAQALLKLDAECRQLLKRYWFDGIPLKELVEELQAPSEDAIKQRHKRCRERLRKIFGRDPRSE